MATTTKSELSEIKRILAHLVGSTDLPKPQQFSKSVLDKAAKEFKKLKIREEQWLKSYEVERYFKDCRGDAGKFIREEFGFVNFYRKGIAYLYSKNDVINLAQELKSRNVDLGKYMELRREQGFIEKQLLELAKKNRDLRVKKIIKKNPYNIPDDLQDISFSDYRLPDQDVVEQHIKDLMQEFRNGDHESYIDIYTDSAWIKYDNYTRSYLEGGKGTAYKSWCNKYNKAQYALRLIKEHQDKESSQ